LNIVGTATPPYHSILQIATAATSGTLPLASFLDLTPYAVGALASMFGLETSVQAAADFFEQWDGEMWLEYRPSGPTTQKGAFIWWVERDPVDRDEDQLNSQAVLQIAEEHGARTCQYFEPGRWKLFSTGKKWLRQAANADVRKVSAGHLFVVTQNALTTDDVLGLFVLHYKLRFSGPTSKELNYNSFWTAVQDETMDSNYSLIFNNTNRKKPFSGTVLGYSMDTMAAANPTSLTDTKVLVLNHAYTTPLGSFVQVNASCDNAKTTLTLNYYIGGTLQADGGTYITDFNVVNAAGGAGASWTVFIPAGTPPDAAVITVTHTALASTDPGFATTSVWTLPSTLFEGDFIPSARASNWAAILQAKRIESKQLSVEDRDFTSVTEDDEDLHQEYKFPPEVDAQIAEFPGDQRGGIMRAYMRRHPPPSKKSSTKSEPGPPKLASNKYGEASNPGPYQCNPQQLLAWLKEVRLKDLTVRQSRVDSAKAFAKCEEKDGRYEVSEERYERTVLFMLQTRNPADDGARIRFNDALLACNRAIGDMKTEVEKMLQV
jgi:hypothetical protein